MMVYNKCFGWSVKDWVWKTAQRRTRWNRGMISIEGVRGGKWEIFCGYLICRVLDPWWVRSARHEWRCRAEGKRDWWIEVRGEKRIEKRRWVQGMWDVVHIYARICAIIFIRLQVKLYVINLIGWSGQLSTKDKVLYKDTWEMWNEINEKIIVMLYSLLDMVRGVSCEMWTVR